MRNKILLTAKHSFIYALPNFVNKFVGFLLLPLITTYLTPKEYGIWIVFEVTINILSQILTLGQPAAYLRYYYSTQHSPTIKQYFTSQLLFIGGLVFLLFFAVTSSLPYWVQIFSNPALFKNLIFLSLIIISLRILNSFLLSDLRARQKPLGYSLIVILQALVLLGSTWTFLKVMRLQIVSIFYGHFVSNIIIFILLALLIIPKRISFSVNLTYLKKAVEYGWPLVFGSIGWMLLNMGDRYVLKYLTNYAQTGLYGFAYKIGQLPFYFIVQPFLVAYHPLAFKWYEHEKDTTYFAKIFLYITIVLMLLSLPIVLWADYVVQILTPKQAYWEVYSVIGIIAFGYLWTAGTQVINVAYSIKKKTKIIASLSLGIAILNILLNFILIPPYGYKGAAVATAISFLIQFFISFRIANRLFPVPYEVKKYFLMIIVWFAIVLINRIVLLDSVVKVFVIRIILFITFPMVLYKLQLFNKGDLKALLQLFNKK